METTRIEKGGSSAEIQIVRGSQILPGDDFILRPLVPVESLSEAEAKLRATATMATGGFVTDDDRPEAPRRARRGAR